MTAQNEVFSRPQRPTDLSDHIGARRIGKHTLHRDGQRSALCRNPAQPIAVLSRGGRHGQRRFCGFGIAPVAGIVVLRPAAALAIDADNRTRTHGGNLTQTVRVRDRRGEGLVSEIHKGNATRDLPGDSRKGVGRGKSDIDELRGDAAGRTSVKGNQVDGFTRCQQRFDFSVGPCV